MDTFGSHSYCWHIYVVKATIGRRLDLRQDVPIILFFILIFCHLF